MQLMEMGDLKSAFFPADLQNGIGGCIVHGPGLEPSDKGTLVCGGSAPLQLSLTAVKIAASKSRS
jgi:hypothetical protein